jgi:hemerythrin-like domain-containing protein
MQALFDRRHVLSTTTGLLVAGSAPVATAVTAQDHNEEAQAEKVTPPEDLMREHGVLNRVLLIYESVIRKIEDKHDFDPHIIIESAQIVQQFIEGYHERNEEQQVFPRFRKAGQLVDLVNVLYQQHQAGRRLTDTILGLVPKGPTLGDTGLALVREMRAFIVMYRPHEAREDTVLFPKLRGVVSANEFDAMAEDFERDEHKKFGEDGFEHFVERVANLEKQLGIYDLAKFTSR